MSKNISNEVDMISLGQKLGKIEINTTHLEDKINEEHTQRINLERKTQKMNEDFNIQINVLKNGFDSFSDAFTNGMDQMKNAIQEDIEFKIASLTKILMETMKKIDSFENSDSNFATVHKYKTEIDKRLLQLEKFVSIPLPNRDRDINNAITKINFIEKKLNDNIKNVNSRLDTIENEIKNIKTSIELFKASKESNEKHYEHLQRDFISTNSNNSKFIYQTTMLLNEVKDKVNQFEDVLQKSNENIQTFKNDFTFQFNELKQHTERTVNTLGCDFGRVESNLLKTQELFQDHVMNQNEKFVNFVQDKLEVELTQSKENYMQWVNDFNALQANQNETKEKLKLVQKEFFNNLNEIEEFMNKKYDNICKVINIQH